LGNLYASDYEIDISRNVEIDQLLTTYYKGSYDITNIMKNVRIQIQPCFEYDILKFTYKNILLNFVCVCVCVCVCMCV